MMYMQHIADYWGVSYLVPLVVVIWSLGALVASFIIGFIESGNEDPGSVVIVSFLWPAILVLTIVILIIAGPFWLGGKTATLFRKRGT